MGFVGDIVGGIFGGGDDASKAATDAAAIQAQGQREALEYLKQIEEIPQQFRSAALTRLGGLYGLPGGEGSQQQLIGQARQSPLYSAIMGGRKAGEESIMRQAGATGGLRSGNVQSALADYNTQLQNQALLEAYNQQLSGLTGLAQLPSNATQIASGISGIGETLAAGKLASGQAQQASTQQGWGNLLGLAGLIF